MTAIRKYLIGAPAYYLLLAIPDWTGSKRRWNLVLRLLPWAGLYAYGDQS